MEELNSFILLNSGNGNVSLVLWINASVFPGALKAAQRPGSSLGPSRGPAVGTVSVCVQPAPRGSHGNDLGFSTRVPDVVAASTHRKKPSRADGHFSQQPGTLPAASCDRWHPAGSSATTSAVHKNLWTRAGQSLCTSRASWSRFFQRKTS